MAVAAAAHIHIKTFTGRRFNGEPKDSSGRKNPLNLHQKLVEPAMVDKDIRSGNGFPATFGLIKKLADLRQVKLPVTPFRAGLQKHLSRQIYPVDRLTETSQTFADQPRATAEIKHLSEFRASQTFQTLAQLLGNTIGQSLAQVAIKSLCHAVKQITDIFGGSNGRGIS